MTTLADLMAAIADDADDTTGEYSAQIKRAIQTAQRYCERHSFYFNETRDVTFQTSIGKEWYGAAENANIPTSVRIVAAYRVDGSTTSEMTRVHPAELEGRAISGPTGAPTDWTYFNQKIRLYPIPGGTPYTIRLQLGPYRLLPLENATDTNAWLSEAYDMIKARAKYILYKDTLKDPALAAEALNDYNDQFDALKSETASRTGTGFIVPSQF